MELRKKKISIRWKVPAKWTIFGLTMGVVLATVGSIAALNGWFGGGSSVPEDTMTRGLVGYWGFEEGSGTIAHDASNYANNATTSGTAPSWTKGKAGSALSFDGSDDYVSVSDVDVLSFGNSLTDSPFSISAWVKMNDATNFVIASKGVLGTNGEWWLQTQADDTLNFTLADESVDAYRQVFSSQTLTSYQGQWIHLVGTYDGNASNPISGMKWFLNGVQLSMTTGSGGTYTAMENLTGEVRIGRRAADYANGLIDEVRIYNRALSADEVRYHYNRGGPVAQWKMDEGEGRTVYDSTDNNNDGTLVLAGSATSSAWVSGKEGTALSFDGTDDYVEIANETNFDFDRTSKFSISAWIKTSSATNQIIVDKMLGASPWTGYAFFTGSGTTAGTLYIQMYGSSASNGINKRTVETINDGNWHLVTLAFDGSSTAAGAKIYKDGVECSYTTLLDTFSTSMLNNVNFYIGVGHNGGYPFNGLIDEVRVYNYARTPDEIRLDYNAGFAAKFGYTAAGCQRDPASCMTQGLVGYWGFEEGSGTIAHDASNYANNATTSGTAPSWTKGKVGSALSFDGVNDYVGVADSDSLDSGSLAVEAWVKRGANSTNLGSSYHMIVGKSFENAYGLGININNQRIAWVVDVNGDATGIESAATFINEGVWTHLIGTHDSSNGSTKLYINGVLVGEITQNGSVSATANNLIIGSDSSSLAQRYFDGLIDEVRIYNRALSAEEARYHYNKGGPVGQWKMDEGEGRTAYDSTENNNDGTLVLAGSATSSAWVAGKYGSALSFDGSNDYVSTPLDVSSTSFTLEAWINSPLTESADYLRGILDKRSSSAEWRLTKGNGAYAQKDKIVFLAWDSSAASTKSILGNTILTANTWYHVALTYDGTTAVLYLNAVIDGSSSTGNPIRDTVSVVRIGTDVLNANRYWDGLIDDVRIYNYTRTAEQIKLDYNAGLVAYFGPSTGSGQAQCNDDPGACMTNGLVGYWGMEEGSGTLVHDSSGYANNATTSGTAPSWTKGKVGGALQFDGVDDNIVVSSSSTLNPAQISIEMWFKVISWKQPYNTLVAKWWDGTDRNYETGLHNTGYVYFNTAFTGHNADHIVQSAAGSIVIGTWYHMIGTYNGLVVRLYLNGVEVGTPISETDSLRTNTVQFGIGADMRAVPVYFNNSIIDDVRVYNRALSAEEVRYHYNRGGPVAQWKMDEGSGSTAYDSTENNNDGTLYWMSTSTQGGWIEGKYGSALNFDGVDDYVKVLDNDNLDLVTAHTISAWIKPNSFSGSQGLVSKSDGSSASKGWYFAVDGASSRVTLWYITSSGNHVIYYSGTFTAGVWHHIVATYDSSLALADKGKFYIDGIASIGAAYLQTGTFAGIGTNSLDVKIGTLDGSLQMFNGLIDDVRIYNYARTMEQIRQDYNAGLSAHFK